MDGSQCYVERNAVVGVKDTDFRQGIVLNTQPEKISLNKWSFNQRPKRGKEVSHLSFHTGKAATVSLDEHAKCIWDITRILLYMEDTD